MMGMAPTLILLIALLVFVYSSQQAHANNLKKSNI